MRVSTTCADLSPSFITYVEGDWSNDEKLITQAKKINNHIQFIYKYMQLSLHEIADIVVLKDQLLNI